MIEKLQYAVIALLLLHSIAFAESEDISVKVSREEGGSYVFNLYFVADAPADEVFAIFTDYDNLSILNPSIKTSRLLESEEPGVTRVEIISENCILFFCKELMRVEDVRVIKDKSIEATLIPELSNFKSGEAFWAFTQEGDKTVVTMRAKVVPDFWIPPFLGPRSIMKSIRQQLHHTAETVDDLLMNHKDE